MTSKNVVVTGASTGIGRACALRMDRAGWTVYAGVRKEQDGAGLAKEASSRLVPVKLDVTDEDTITSVAKMIEDEAGGQLGGLVNNAGITVQGPLEFLPPDELRNQFEVNVIGQIVATQAFLPAIRKATGRIVFMSSIAGRAESLPLIGPYSSSKRALEALAEALRTELHPWRIRVSVVEPGSVATPIWDKGDATFDEFVAGLPAEARERYGTAMEKGRQVASATGRRGIPAEKVAAKVEHALTSAHPRFRYLVGLDARARTFAEPLIPTPLRDRGAAKLLGFDKPPS